MSNLKEVICHKATDGTVFEDKNRAEKYQKYLDKKEEYNKNCMYSEEGYKIDFTSVKSWLIGNKDLVLKMLEGK